MLTHREISEALAAQPLFDEKTWRLSPEAWPVTAREAAELEEIGKACLEFYRALESLYMRVVDGKNLLRNRKLTAPWVVEYLDRGKPRSLVEHARSKRNRGLVPSVIRPDLLRTDEGYAMTEMDSVPGGIGLTAYLNQLYFAKDDMVIGGKEGMIDAFYRAMSALVPDKRLPLVAILVSDEAATYRPEMQWLADALQRKGKRVHCLHPSEVMPLGDTLCASIEGNPEQIDVVYRFWELFDLANVPIAEHILNAWDESQLVVTPPMRPFQEEKLSLALFHHHLLEDYWKENLSKRAFKLLKKIIPKSWVMDPVDLPPNAVLDAPLIGGKPITKWEQLGSASQKERNLIIKLSGFHESAWGARSVTLGSDVSKDEWSEAISEATNRAEGNLSILQEYHKPRRLKHPVFFPDERGENNETFPMEGRIRLCPYYFVVGDEVEMAGVLTTFCPADKKIIHGMKDAAMLPTTIRNVEEEK